MRLRDKVAVITGGASGIGKAIACMFAREGATVIIADLADEAGREVAAGIRGQGGRATSARVDVSQPEDVRGLVEHVVESYGGPDVLVNCAGVHFIGEDVEAHATSEDVWERTLAINLTGTFLPCKYAIPHMVRRGGGSIVNVSSISGVIGRARNAAYTATKGGVISLTKSIAYDYLDQGIRANVVIPSRIDTPLMRRLMADPTTPREPDCGEPDDVAYCAVYLASDESKFVTGAEFMVDRGLSAR